MLQVSNHKYQITMKDQMTKTEFTSKKAQLLQTLKLGTWSLEIAATEGAF